MYQASCSDCLPLHAQVIEDVYAKLDSTDTVRSHYFNGRYENIYLDKSLIRGLDCILDCIQREAARLLDVDRNELQLGYWLNIMHYNDVTLLHSHDDNDELLSGTYYLQVPEKSGRLLIHCGGPEPVSITAKESAYVLFHPAVEHEVTAHLNTQARISLGFNIGAPAKA